MRVQCNYMMVAMFDVLNAPRTDRFCFGCYELHEDIRTCTVYKSKTKTTFDKILLFFFLVLFCVLLGSIHDTIATSMHIRRLQQLSDIHTTRS